MDNESVFSYIEVRIIHDSLSLSLSLSLSTHGSEKMVTVLIVRSQET